MQKFLSVIIALLIPVLVSADNCASGYRSGASYGVKYCGGFNAGGYSFVPSGGGGTPTSIYPEFASTIFITDFSNTNNPADDLSTLGTSLTYLTLNVAHYWVAPTNRVQGHYFDTSSGGTATNSYTGDLELGDGALALWFNPAAQDQQPDAGLKKFNGSTDGVILWQTITGSGSWYYLFEANNTQVKDDSWGIDPRPSVWQLIAVDFDRDGNASGYVNGLLASASVQSMASVSTFTQDNSSAWTIDWGDADNYDGTHYGWKGAILGSQHDELMRVTCTNWGFPTWLADTNYWDDSINTDLVMYATFEQSDGLKGQNWANKNRVGNDIDFGAGAAEPSRGSENGNGFIFAGIGDWLEPTNKPITTATNYSIAWWVKPTTEDHNDYFLDFRANGALIIGNRIGGGNDMSFHNGTAWVDGGSPIPTNEWSHLCFTVTNGYGKLYADNVLQAEGAMTSTAPLGGTSPKELPDTASISYLDDFACWGRGITDSERTLWYNQSTNRYK